MGRRGRPPLPDPDVIRTYIRYAKLLDAGMSITAAEKEMLKTGEPCQHLTSRQGVRKRLIHGKFVLIFVADSRHAIMVRPLSLGSLRGLGNGFGCHGAAV